MKRLLALLLATLMLFALAACGEEEAKENTLPQKGEFPDPLTKDDVIKITLYSHASWPYDQDWVIWDYIEEAVGATLEIDAIPSADAATKYPLMFTDSELMPDLATFDYKPDTDKYAAQGALVAIDTLAENGYLPNYEKWLTTLSPDEVKNVIDIRKSADGKIYYAPATGREAATGMLAWLYRADIFEKNNLAVPTTFDELYKVCKKLKTIYPDSYPFAMRNGMSCLETTGSSWKEYWSPNVYYDYNEGKWEYGAREEILLPMLEFYKKMVAEGLMLPDFFNITAAGWEEIINTNRGFIFPDFRTRIDKFNGPARKQNPDFKITAFVPPVANEETGVPKMLRRNDEALGYVFCNTQNAERIANAAKYVDWFYTDEAMDLVSWGKEGETYTVNANGEREYIADDSGASKEVLYGISTHGTFLRFDPDAIIATLNKETLEVKELTETHMLDYPTPVRYLAFTDEESAVIEEYKIACDNYANEMIQKFILGQEPLTKFDEFVNTLNGLGVDKVLEAYTSAYNRVK